MAATAHNLVHLSYQLVAHQHCLTGGSTTKNRLRCCQMDSSLTPSTWGRSARAEHISGISFLKAVAFIHDTVFRRRENGDFFSGTLADCPRLFFTPKKILQLVPEDRAFLIGCVCNTVHKKRGVRCAEM